MMSSSCSSADEFNYEAAFFPMEQSLEFFNDFHPFEVDMIASEKRRCDSVDVRRKRAFTCTQTGSGAMRMPGNKPIRPAAFVYDGRLINKEKERRFLMDPCAYWRNVYPWQCFRLRRMRILGNRSMPAYELLSSEAVIQEKQDDFWPRKGK